MTEYSGRDASHNISWWDILGDHAARPDDRTLTNRHATQDHCPGTDRGTAAYAGRNDIPVGFCLQRSFRSRRAGDNDR